MKIILTLMVVVFATTFVAESANAQGFQAQEEHALLKKDVGVWDAKGKMWMPGVADPLEFEGVETNEMLGDLFTITDFRGDFGGMAFRGHGRVGFNPTSKKYESTWFDVTNPWGMTGEGTYDADSKTLTLMTTSKSATGEDKKGKSTLHYQDKNTRVMTAYSSDPEDGDKMVKEMEIIYTRKQ